MANKKVQSLKFKVQSKRPTTYNLQPTNSIMEQLLASAPQKVVSLSRNQQVLGEVVAITPKEVILDLNSKSEGVIAKKEFSQDQAANLKIGQKIKAFVSEIENESGQTILSLRPTQPKPSRKRRGGVSYDNFIQAQRQERELSGLVVEANKGGLIVDVSGTTGFLPNSQVGFDLLSKISKDPSDLVGQQLKFKVIEVDEGSSRLIFSQRTKLSDDLKNKLESFKNKEKISGKIVAILPFGLVVDVEGLEGLVFISDVAWEKVEDLNTIFKIGQAVEAKVTGIDLELGRINLSIKHLSEDPFEEISKKFQADDLVKGEVVSATDTGVVVKLEGGVEGFLPAAKMSVGETHQVGSMVNLLVDSVDLQRRRVNLAPMITTTEGLIYK